MATEKGVRARSPRHPRQPPSPSPAVRPIVMDALALPPSSSSLVLYSHVSMHAAASSRRVILGTLVREKDLSVLLSQSGGWILRPRARERTDVSPRCLNLECLLAFPGGLLLSRLMSVCFVVVVLLFVCCFYGGALRYKLCMSEWMPSGELVWIPIQ